MLTTIIFFFALLLSYQAIESLCVDLLNKSDDHYKTRLVTKVFAVILWSYLFYLLN